MVSSSASHGTLRAWPAESLRDRRSPSYRPTSPWRRRSRRTASLDGNVSYGRMLIQPCALLLLLQDLEPQPRRIDTLPDGKVRADGDFPSTENRVAVDERGTVSLIARQSEELGRQARPGRPGPLRMRLAQQPRGALARWSQLSPAVVRSLR